MPQLPIALQLYSLRAETRSDFAGTLRRVAAMGYGAVELPATGNPAPAELAALLDDLGLSVAALHARLQDLDQNLDGVIARARQLGCGYIVCPKLPLGLDRYRAAGWQAAARRFNRIGAACAAQGVQFCYHNHTWEFRRFGGRTALEILLAQSDPAHVQIEPDVYWAQAAGHDPVALVRQLAGRVPLLHLKDMCGRFWRSFTELGRGRIDIPALITAAEQSGTAWLIVEQDRFTRPPLESVRLSLEYLRSNPEIC
ncbi:MAG: sugar phosphate isomerase/epimerase family protein [Chloroflexaceae bacterium]